MHVPRSSTYGCLSLLLVFASIHAVAAPTDTRPVPPSPLKSVLQHLYAPYWVTESGWETGVQLRNNLTDTSLAVQPILHAASGETVNLDSTTVPPSQVVTINLNNLLASAIAKTGTTVAQRFGYLELQYTAATDKSLFAPLLIGVVGQPIMFHIDSRPELNLTAPSVLNGFWWNRQHSASDVLALANVSGIPNAVQLLLTDTAGKQLRKQFTLAPKSMVRMSVLDLVRGSNLTGDFGAIHIESQRSGSVASLNFVYDTSNGFSALMKLFESMSGVDVRSIHRLRKEGWMLWGPMLALASPDPGLAVPAGTTFHPYLFIENLAATPVHAQIRLNWRSRSSSGIAQPQTVTLTAGQAQKLDVMQTFKDLPTEANWATVTIVTDSAPDQLIAVAASYDDTGRFGAQTPFSDQVAAHWEGGKWEVDSMHNSLITVGNGGDKPARAQITFRYQGAQGPATYVIQQPLASDQQLFIDLGELVRTQKPDINGQTFSPSATEGTYSLVDLENPVRGGLFEGKVVTDKRYGAAHYGCMICCGLNPDTYFDPLPLGLFPGETTSLNAYATDSCTHNRLNINDYLASWWSDNTAVATAQPGQGTGVDAGSTTLWGDGYLPGSTNGTVDDPNACPQNEATPQTEADVNDFTVEPQSGVPDGGEASFAITITHGTAQTYAWSYTTDYPESDGNNPEVTFYSPTAAQTATDAHWYASSGVVCASPHARYNIYPVVTFANASLPLRKKTYLTVDIPDPGGKVDEARITGSAEVTLFSDGVWRVTGSGTLTRVIATPDIFVLSTSQFYNKISTHENKHVTQWQSGLFSDLYLVSNFYAQISGLTDSTQSGLKSQIDSALTNYVSQQHQVWQSRYDQAEGEAYMISDPIAPQYYYQSNCVGIFE